MFTDKKERLNIVLYALGMSLFAVIFMWGFWRYGIDVLGVNSIIYSLGMLGFFLYVAKNSASKSAWLWLVPVGVIALSLGIYTNSFTKSISLVLLPMLFFIFSTHEVHKNLRPALWSHTFLIEALFAFLDYVGGVFKSLGTFIFPKDINWAPHLSSSKKDLTKQIIWGLLIFALFAIIVVVPLLSGADAGFALIFKDIMHWLGDVLEAFFEANIVYRLFVTLVGTMILLGYALHWRKTLQIGYPERSGERMAKKYAVTIGVVLVGTLALYLIFIGLQIKNLFVGELPINFHETEYLVKTGFWQLFMLTVINIFFYMGIYGKTIKKVETILSLFTFASLLLIVSGAQRIYLYVTNYGLSYEKFYAFYTVLFCIGVFVWFLALFAAKNKEVEVFKKLAFAALWMYALTTIIPLERMIVSANLVLTQQPESRININELRMLGYDALPFIQRNYERFLPIAKEDFKAHYERHEGEEIPSVLATSEYTYDYSDQDFAPWGDIVEKTWSQWRETTVKNSRNLSYNMSYDESVERAKKWYEKTLMEIIYKAK